MKPAWKKMVICLGMFILWLQITAFLWSAYLAVSIILNSGHPWPYHPWLICGEFMAFPVLNSSSGMRRYQQQ